MTVIKLVGLATGEPSPADGHYVVEYDPSAPPEPGMATTCLLRTSPRREDAKVFETAAAAMKCWRAVDQRAPRRPGDGRPNRPLTAFTTEFL